MIDVVEATGRSSCKKCKEKLPQGEQVIKEGRSIMGHTEYSCEHVLCWIKEHPGIVALIQEQRTLMDITAPEVIQLVIRNDSKVVWINGPGGNCLFRACQIGSLVIDDRRDRLERIPKGESVIQQIMDGMYDNHVRLRMEVLSKVIE